MCHIPKREETQSWTWNPGKWDWKDRLPPEQDAASLQMKQRTARLHWGAVGGQGEAQFLSKSPEVRQAENTNCFRRFGVTCG